VSFVLYFRYYKIVSIFTEISRLDIKQNPMLIQMNRVDQLKQIQGTALELFIRKNADYGDAFAEYGTVGVLMRIEDKLHRYMSITRTGVQLVNEEGLRDTLLDLHNYAAMAIMLLDT
jgi:hypothetical protein